MEHPTEWGHTIAVLDKKFGVITLSNDIIVPFIYDRIRYTHKNYFIVRQNDLEGIVDIDGNIVLPLEYERVYSLHSDGIARVKIDGERSEIKCTISLN